MGGNQQAFLWAIVPLGKAQAPLTSFVEFVKTRDVGGIGKLQIEKKLRFTGQVDYKFLEEIHLAVATVFLDVRIAIGTWCRKVCCFAIGRIGVDQAPVFVAVLTVFPHANISKTGITHAGKTSPLLKACFGFEMLYKGVLRTVVVGGNYRLHGFFVVYFRGFSIVMNHPP